MELKDLTFGQWLTYVFDHPEDDRDWHFDIDADWWNEGENPLRTLEYLARLFRNMHSATAQYSEAQIAHGLWFLASNACSNHMHCLFDGQILWTAREPTFSAIYTLYAQYFVRRCTAHLSHTIYSVMPPNISPLNSICYMWWDMDWFSPQPNNLIRYDIDSMCLDIMERTLHLKSMACQEAALHGLGHWKFGYPERVTRAIDAYLEREPALPDALKAYALAAREGCVL
ncbi:MAG: hypothetical protein U0694_21780 [Anaerolineae bacterium]